MNFADYGKEILLLAIDAVIFSVSLKWHNQNRKALQALSGPVLVEGRSLDEWLQAHPDDSSWVVLQGFVESLGPVIHSFNDRSIKGVVQRLKVKEFVTSRNTSGFWQDGERVIADSFNTVPFALRVGRSVVNVEQPLNSSLLTLRTVSSEFTQKNSNMLDHVWSFLIGTRHRGIQTTEEMLLCGTKLTGMGVLAKDKTLSSASGILLQPYCLSELTVAELKKQIRSQARWSSTFLLLSGIAGIAVITYVARKLLKEYKKKFEEADRRERRIKRTREAHSDELKCIVCENNPREVILLPCGHICLCYDCSQAISWKCPMCRSTVQSINEYFIT